jgi:hypothetical protein
MNLHWNRPVIRIDGTRINPATLGAREENYDIRNILWFGQWHVGLDIFLLLGWEIVKHVCLRRTRIDIRHTDSATAELKLYFGSANSNRILPHGGQEAVVLLTAIRRVMPSTAAFDAA